MLSKNKIKLIRSLELKKHRKEHNLFIIEGEKMVDELLASSLSITEIYATDSYFHQISNIYQTLNINLITEKELGQISQLKTPNQVLALANIPSNNSSEYNIKQGLFLALDNIQDPGNLGTIIRTANWFGVTTIFCSADTVDAYNSKVVQATMGALFSTQVIYTELVNVFENAKNHNIPTYGTSLKGENLYTKPLPKNALIVMGNESKGISENTYSHIDEKILIPTFAEKNANVIESLNVGIATSIVLAEFRRQALGS